MREDEAGHGNLVGLETEKEVFPVAQKWLVQEGLKIVQLIVCIPRQHQGAMAGCQDGLQG